MVYTMFIQYKISLSLGLDILKLKQVTGTRPTLSKISKYCRSSWLDRRQLKRENHLEENFKIEFQISSLGKHHVGLNSYLKSIFLMFSYVLLFYWVLEWIWAENSVRNLNLISHFLILFTELKKGNRTFLLGGPFFKMYISNPCSRLKRCGWQYLTGSPRNSP